MRKLELRKVRPHAKGTALGEAEPALEPRTCAKWLHGAHHQARSKLHEAFASR